MPENPNVSSPSGLHQLPSNSSSAAINESGDSDGEIRCVCGYTEDDGFTICCDACGLWQHFACMQLREDDLAEKYLCSICSPRPVDARKARELQTQRRRDEKNNRRKRPASASRRRKESQPAGGDNNGAAPAAALSGPEKPGVFKLPSFREPQQPASAARKRNRRTSHSSQPVGNGRGSGCVTDRNGDVESDTDLDKYKFEFLGVAQNRYANEDVRNLLSAMCESVSQRYTQKDIASLSHPKATVQLFPDSSKSYSEHPRWCFMLEAPCSMRKPIALFNGEVGFQETYKSEPINQYGLWHHPKPYVVFHPELPIYIDARRFGSEARFARRSCRPNLDVKTIVADDTQVYFGLFPLEPLKPGTELTIGWDWNGSAQMQHIVNSSFDLSGLTTDEIKQAALWIDNLVEKMGDCACAGPLSDCLLAKIRNSGESIDVVAPSKRIMINSNDGGGAKKQRTRQNPSTGSPASKKPAPDLTVQSNDGDDVSKVKAKPRRGDLTLSLAQDTAVESGTMTAREARKFKDILSRFEKIDKQTPEQQQQHQQQQGQPNKRRKRNSTAALPVGTARPASPGCSEKARGKRPLKTTSPATSPGSVVVVDASTGRTPDCSSSPVASVDHHHHHGHGTSSKSPVTSSTLSKVRRKVKTRAPKSNYADASVQTDPDVELPWWKQPVQRTPPRPPRLPLRKRLMQSFLRDREAATAAGNNPMQDKPPTLPPSLSQPQSQSEPSQPQTQPQLQPQPQSQSEPSEPQLQPHVQLQPQLQPQPQPQPQPQLQPQTLQSKSESQPPQPQSEPQSPPQSQPQQLQPQLQQLRPQPHLPQVPQKPPPASPSRTKMKKLSLEDYRRRIMPKTAETSVPDKSETAVLKGVNDDPSKQLAFLNVLGPSADAPAP